MSQITLTLPIPPTLNGYWRNIVVDGRPRTLLSKAGREYKRQVGEICLVRGVKPLACDVHVSIVVYRARKIGDLDNYLKSLLDALQGWAYTNDNQIVGILMLRRDDAQVPRVEVGVSEIMPRGDV